MQDSLGDAGGDEAIIEMANRLRRAVPTEAQVGGLSSRKFALVLPTIDPAQMLITASAVRDTVARVMWVNQVVQMSASVGFALAPRDGVNARELMRRSRLAVRTARRRGRGVVVRLRMRWKRTRGQNFIA
jgi:diguanylate cyclase (GGDEF)-like protein